MHAHTIGRSLLVASIALAACDSFSGPAQDLKIEALPEVRTNLPAVPTIPPPPHPIQHPDQSYSVYGLRRRLARTMSTDLAITGYIVEVYTPSECPRGHTCPPPKAPHFYIADTKDERDPTKLLLVTNYAMNQQEIDEAIEALAKGRPLAAPEGSDQPPVPGDLFVGAKIKVQGKFLEISSNGFTASDGVLDYRGHQTLEPGTPPAAP